MLPPKKLTDVYNIKVTNCRGNFENYYFTDEPLIICNLNRFLHDVYKIKNLQSNTYKNRKIFLPGVQLFFYLYILVRQKDFKYNASAIVKKS